ncbi:type II toxin-antitoxin system Phd/YefM family antitoxin [Salinibacter ruber]|uniref:type II toxin-antitoxin system Phd/YefM family antitoxin n=1 Tax=Salinibacter ruber TaxID=146919 RepID=UPI00216A0DC7|nr:antitoxin (DNA-binding transcriptional repressor) of toxin-antitoxin stability system [Salinibacter ruber]
MTQVPLREAQDCLGDLLARVEEGETILITRSGRPRFVFGLYSHKMKRRMPCLRSISGVKIFR